MKRKGILTVIMAFLITLLPGCKPKEDGDLTGIIFDRGNGSVWGTQLYIEVNAQEIVTARYIPEGTAEVITVQHISITDTQWQDVKSAAEQLPLKKPRTDLWKKHKLDGSDYRRLLLCRGKKMTEYRWPNVPQAQQLELLLEALLADSLEPGALLSGTDIPVG